MNYINTETLAYPVGEKQIKALYHNVSWGTPFTPPVPFAAVEYTTQPSYDNLTQFVTEQPPVQQGGKWVQVWQVNDLTAGDAASRIQTAINVARAAAHRRIDDAYTAQTNQLAEGYPENEQKSWPVQIMEADAILAGAETPTPWVDAASAGRGITRLEMAQLIKAQDTAYRTYHGQLSGVRQALRDQIDAVPDGERTSIAALDAIDWPEPPEEPEV